MSRMCRQRVKVDARAVVSNTDTHLNGYDARVVVSALVALLACACTPVYMAPAANAPLLSKQSELHLAAYMGTNGLDAQLAYSVTDSVAVTGSVSADPSGHEDEDPSETAIDLDNSHLYGEAALGYYLPFEKNFVFEAFAGAGGGSTRGELVYWGETMEETAESSGTYFRPFLQADVGLSFPALDLGAAARWCVVRYDYSTPDVRFRDDVAYMLFMEPILFGRLGWKAFKVETQIGFVIPMWGNQDLNMGWMFFHFALGLHLRFDLGENGDE